MRLLRNLLSKLTRPAPKRDFAHVHDVQIKWERTPIGKDDNTKDPGSMSLNGTCVRCSIGWPFPVDELVGSGGDVHALDALTFGSRLQVPPGILSLFRMKRLFCVKALPTRSPGTLFHSFSR